MLGIAGLLPFLHLRFLGPWQPKEQLRSSLRWASGKRSDYRLAGTIEFLDGSGGRELRPPPASLRSSASEFDPLLVTQSSDALQYHLLRGLDR